MKKHLKKLEKFSNKLGADISSGEISKGDLVQLKIALNAVDDFIDSGIRYIESQDTLTDTTPSDIFADDDDAMFIESVKDFADMTGKPLSKEVVDRLRPAYSFAQSLISTLKD